jgi:hypothetical protein
MMANIFSGPDILVLLGVFSGVAMPIAMFVTVVWLIRKCSRELADAIRQRPIQSESPTSADPLGRPRTK